MHNLSKYAMSLSRQLDIYMEGVSFSTIVCLTQVTTLYAQKAK